MDETPPGQWPLRGAGEPPEAHDPYVVRYSASPASLFWLVTCVLVSFRLAQVGLQTGDPVPWAMLAFVGSFGLILIVVHVLRFGKIALQVDSRGITVGGLPARDGEKTQLVPWAAIRSVVIYRVYLYRLQGFGPATGRFIGLRGTEAPIVFPDRPDPTIDQPGFAAMIKRLQRTVPHVPPDVSYSGLRIWGWPLSRSRLAEAVARFAPHVEVVDAG